MDGSICNIDTTAPAWTINASPGEVWLAEKVWLTGRPLLGFLSPPANTSPFSDKLSPVSCWLSLFDMSVTKFTLSTGTSDDRGCRCNLGDSDCCWIACDWNCLQWNHLKSSSSSFDYNSDYSFLSLLPLILSTYVLRAYFSGITPS